MSISSGTPTERDPARLRHQRRNEIQAIRLGLRLLQEQLGSGEWEQAKLTTTALAACAEALQNLEELPNGAEHSGSGF